ncbi:unnamed protein product [Heligmosomoides polygyrus]|uniref:Macro domain-containing protein n=1 Tax=Heligmosomoides polygyrus TaxID=6339 RepID=A0A183GQ23_HELPZ|nr:unnamed protein product [Heligmosomoides polygyrus]
MLIGVDHTLNLRHRCGCGLFGQRAHVAIPSLQHQMARSKRVDDVFDLANVAAIAEQEFWGDERKEQELRKQSTYLTPYGLVVATDAHRHRCVDYAEAVEAAKGVRFEHTTPFDAPVLYDAGAYLTAAIGMLGQLQGAVTRSKPLTVFIVLPAAFGREHTDVACPDHVLAYVYMDWQNLAKKLVDIKITSSMIIVWPDELLEDIHMRRVLVGLEMHLQAGGTLMFLPHPYEDNNDAEWTHMGEVSIREIHDGAASELPGIGA